MQPSLNGTDDDGDAKTSKNASSGGVWGRLLFSVVVVALCNCD